MSSKKKIEEINKRIQGIKRRSGMPTEVLTFEGWESVLPVFTKDIEYLMERVQDLEELSEHRLKMLKYCSDARKEYFGIIKKLYEFDGNVQEHSKLADLLCGEVLEWWSHND